MLGRNPERLFFSKVHKFYPSGVVKLWVTKALTGTGKGYKNKEELEKDLLFHFQVE
jgi:hypothetical protein